MDAHGYHDDPIHHVAATACVDRKRAQLFQIIRHAGSAFAATKQNIYILYTRDIGTYLNVHNITQVGKYINAHP